VAHLSRCVTDGAFCFWFLLRTERHHDTANNLLSELTPLDGTHTATTSYTYNSVFQLTVTPNSGVTSDRANNVTWAAIYAANMLATNMGFLQDAHTDFNQTQRLQATAATYSMGLGKHPRGSNISGNPNTIDVGTKPNNNYGSLVSGLMNCF